MRIILIVFALIITISPVIAAEFKRPGTFWHGKGELCFECHYNTLDSKQLFDKFSGCSCHQRDIWQDPNVLSSKKLSDLHDSEPCVKCHISSKAELSQVSIRQYHTVHENIQCQKCHGSKDISIPADTTQCNFCHKGTPHDVHNEILDEVCVFCHGEVVKKFTPEELEGVKSSTLPLEPEAKVIKQAPPSLLDIILGFLRTLLG